jgi:hypothetical protein
MHRVEFEPSVRAGEDGSCLRQRGHCGPLHTTLMNTKQITLSENSLDLYLAYTWFEFY